MVHGLLPESPPACISCRIVLRLSPDNPSSVARSCCAAEAGAAAGAKQSKGLIPASAGTNDNTSAAKPQWASARSLFARNTTKCVIEKFTAKLTRIAMTFAAHTGMNFAAITTVMVDAVTATSPEPTKPA